MFLRSLRQLHRYHNGVIFRCKTCSELEYVELTEEQWQELKQGLPFKFVFSQTADVEHFEFGLCKQCFSERIVV